MFYRIKEKMLFDYADYKYSDDCLETDIITKTELDKDNQQVIVKGKIIVLNPSYSDIEAEKIKQAKITKIKCAIEELDKKSIRALREGGNYSKTQTYLEYYTEQISILRQELGGLT